MVEFNRYALLFSDFLQKNPLTKTPNNLYAPADYILSLGGKRLRPIFVLLGYDLFHHQVEEALHAAMAIEIFHNFTLMHDDIMDQSELRRGMPTVHKKYDINTAILSGDVMLVKAYCHLAHYDDPRLVTSLLFEFNKMATQVCEGQQYDIEFESRHDVTILEYIDMITLKTAVLIACALKIGAIIGGANEKDGNHLYEFAKYYGIAFQLQDDYLDTFGEACEVGKKIGGDIIKNKKTYLYLKALELCDNKDREALVRLYSSDISDYTESDKIDAVTKIFKSLHVEEYSRQLIQAYMDLAYSHLQTCMIEEQSKLHIKEYMEGLIFRKF